MPNANQTQSCLYRDTDLQKFAALHQRGEHWGFQKKHGFSDGRGHGPGNNSCYACSLAATNPEAGCLVHGIEPKKIEKSSDIA
jgi:hypothetical protein